MKYIKHLFFCSILLSLICCTCMGEFVDFMFHLKETAKVLSVTAIVEIGTVEVLKYYMEQTGLDKEMDIYFYENTNNKYIDDSLDKQNGCVFHIYNGKVLRKFSYSSLLHDAI